MWNILKKIIRLIIIVTLSVIIWSVIEIGLGIGLGVGVCAGIVAGIYEGLIITDDVWGYNMSTPEESNFELEEEDELVELNEVEPNILLKAIKRKDENN